jgi:hypothetical protein
MSLTCILRSSDRGGRRQNVWRVNSIVTTSRHDRQTNAVPSVFDNDSAQSRSNIGQHAPASVGNVYDIFAEYEEISSTDKEKRALLKSSGNLSSHGSALCASHSGKWAEEDADRGDEFLAGSLTQVANDEICAEYDVSTGLGDDGASRNNDRKLAAATGVDERHDPPKRSRKRRCRLLNPLRQTWT